MKRIDIKKFAGTAFSWANYELKNIKRNGNGELIQVTVEASLNTGLNSIDVIYEVDGDGNTTWATDSWTITPVTGTNTVILTKTYASDTSKIKGIQVKSWSNNLEADLYFYFTVVDSNKTTYITKTSATAVLKGNVLNNLSTYDWNNAPSVAAVRNYLDSGSLVHQNDVDDIISQAVSNALLAAHPVGSIEINTTGTNPNEYLGGTWESFGAGRVLMGVGTGTDSNNTSKTFSSAEETGGEYTHKLTVTEMPSHKHPIPYRTSGGGGGNTWYTDPGTADGSSDSKAVAVGGNGYHNNIQPYITVYFWKRVY